MNINNDTNEDTISIYTYIEIKEIFEEIRSLLKKYDFSNLYEKDFPKIKKTLYGNLNSEELEKFRNEYEYELKSLDFLNLLKIRKIKSIENKLGSKNLLTYFRYNLNLIFNSISLFVISTTILIFIIWNIYLIIELNFELILLSFSINNILLIKLMQLKEDRTNIGKSENFKTKYTSYILTKIFLSIFLIIAYVFLHLTNENGINMNYYITMLISILVFSITALVTLFIHENKIFNTKFRLRKESIITFLDYVIIKKDWKENELDEMKLEYYKTVLKTAILIEPSQVNYDLLKMIKYKLMMDFSIVENDGKRTEYEWKLKISFND